MAETIVTLIRHGETTWNLDGRWQGHADVPLSDYGRQQARRLAARLQAEGTLFDHLYTSDLQRASETALIIGAALELPVQALPVLREVHLGVWSGLTTDEVKARYAEQWRLVQQGIGKRGEHGESNAEFDARVTGAIADLTRRHPGEHLAVVTHGGTIKAALRILLGPEQMPNQFIRNTSLTTIAMQNEHWCLQSFNDTEHVDPALGTSPETF